MTDSNVIVSYEDSLQIVKFNRPEKKNALNSQSYSMICNALKRASEDDNIKITLITGIGDYFSSGNDFSSATAIVDEDLDLVIRNKISHVREFVRAVIDFPKILIGLINGPAIGIATTILALFDLVYALDNATFQTPFSSLGVSAEGCSTYTFPKCLGKSLAAKMLYFNYKMTAYEAKSCGFVAEVLSISEVPEFFNNLKKLAELPLKSLVYTKQMLRSHEIKSLHYANTNEIEKLVELFQSEDFLNRIMQTMLKKSNKL